MQCSGRIMFSRKAVVCSASPECLGTNHHRRWWLCDELKCITICAFDIRSAQQRQAKAKTVCARRLHMSPESGEGWMATNQTKVHRIQFIEWQFYSTFSLSSIVHKLCSRRTHTLRYAPAQRIPNHIRLNSINCVHARFAVASSHRHQTFHSVQYSCYRAQRRQRTELCSKQSYQTIP